MLIRQIKYRNGLKKSLSNLAPNLLDQQFIIDSIDDLLHTRLEHRFDVEKLPSKIQKNVFQLKIDNGRFYAIFYMKQEIAYVLQIIEKPLNRG